MTTKTIDCPNCSWLCEISDGMRAQQMICPFCGGIFRAFSSAFRRLEYYLEQVNSSSEKSVFFDSSYSGTPPFKNFTGWIARRVERDEANEVEKLLNVFVGARLAKKNIESLWYRNFQPYFSSPKEVYVEFMALWLAASLNQYQKEDSLPNLFASVLWAWPVTIGGEYQKIVLNRLKSLQKKDPSESLNKIIELEDLSVAPPDENPLFEWAYGVPLAIRQRFILALLYCDHGNSNFEHIVQLDNCTYYSDRMIGIDYGYATKVLIDSNIFCLPEIQHCEKLFKKDELAAILREWGYEVKKNYTREQMFNFLLNNSTGMDWLCKKMTANGFVRLHPGLIDFARDLREYYFKVYTVWKGILQIPMPIK